MSQLSWSRRKALRALALTVPVATLVPNAFARIKARLIIVGGGFGGASAARTLRILLPTADIILIDPNPDYIACPFSNLVIGANRPLSEQTFTLDTLRAEGITVIQDTATNIDPDRKTVQLASDQRLAYDRLVLSPGIDMRWGAIDGYDEAAADTLPHAWKAGPQTLILRDQLHAMKDGGLVIMSVPPAPYRCPPGPYERASLIAHYLKTQKPKSKLLILDSKNTFSKMPLFQDAWAKHYPDHLEWRSAADDGRVGSVDPSSYTVFTDFEMLRGDVINIIPPQKAGWIADRAGVTDTTGWCPIDPVSFQSTLQPDIHVIGDATIAAPMPKSAFAANLHAKISAHAIAEMLAGQTPQPTVLANTCYSFTAPNQAVSIVGVYDTETGTITQRKEAGGLSPLHAPLDTREAEANQARSWFQAISRDAFG